MIILSMKLPHISTNEHSKEQHTYEYIKYAENTTNLKKKWVSSFCVLFYVSGMESNAKTETSISYTLWNANVNMNGNVGCN